MTMQANNDAEQQAIDRLDDGEPAASPEEAHLRAPYQQVIDRLHRLEEAEPPAGWEDRAVKRWSAARRSKRLRILGLGGGIGAAAAAIMAILLVQGLSEVPTLEVAFATESKHRGDPVTLGDTMHVRARAGRTVTLLVYLELELIATCPGSDGCRREGEVQVFELRLDKVGTYRVVRAQGASAAFSPGSGRYEAHVLEARKSGVQLTEQEQKVSQ